jgi:hypothetical protein
MRAPEPSGISYGAAGHSWNSIQAATGCSRATIAKINKRVKAAASALAPQDRGFNAWIGSHYPFCPRT